jgi:topoisomerase-4 subunit A
MLSGLDAVRDESDKSSPVRLVLEPKSSRQDPAEFMQLLLANTRLETSLPINLVLLGRDGRPRSKHLKQIIEEWIAFRFETVTRRTRHRLGEVERRIHILEGRSLALLSIDKVIRIIRKADEPKAGSDDRVRADRHSGRRHPRDPPAPAGTVGGHQDRDRAQGAERPSARS